LLRFDSGGKVKLVKVRCMRDTVIKRWNQLDQGAVDATSINAFKSKLEKLRYTRIVFFMDQSA